MSERQPEPSEPNFIRTEDMLADLPEGRGTTKFSPKEAPAALARKNAMDNSIAELDLTTPEGTQQLDEIRGRFKVAYGRLESVGIEVLPFSLVPRGDSLVVMTRKVDGQEAWEALRQHPDEVLPAVENSLTGMMEYLTAAKASGDEYTVDAMGLHQQMYGHLDGESGPNRLIFVDIDPGPDFIVPGEELRDPYDMFSQLYLVGKDILQIQAELGSDKLESIGQRFVKELEVLQAESATDSGLRQIIGQSIEAFRRHDLEGFRIADGML